jgi:hypothetical protein
MLSYVPVAPPCLIPNKDKRAQQAPRECQACSEKLISGPKFLFLWPSPGISPPHMLCAMFHAYVYEHVCASEPAIHVRMCAHVCVCVVDVFIHARYIGSAMQ